jgi:superfamily II RNA helicase
LERVGRVFAPIFSTQPEKIEEAFDEIHERAQHLTLPEARLRDTQGEEEGSIRLINDLIDSLAGAQGEFLWSLQAEAASMEQAERQINRLRADVWEPFERCARVLDHFGYLDFALERVTDRGRWLADLRVDRPLLVGEALQRGLFAALNPVRAAALIAAIAADEDRDYGELELDDDSRSAGAVRTDCF